jgi:hypothetical protein
LHKETQMRSPLNLAGRNGACYILTLGFALALCGVSVSQEEGNVVDVDPTAPATETDEAAAAAPTTITGEQAEAALTDGQKALDEGDYEKAYKDFTTVYQWGAASQYSATTPEVVQQAQFAVLIGLTGRGQALAGLEEYEAALQEFANAQNILAEFTPTLIARGNMYLDVGAVSDALADFQQAAKISRADLRAQFGLGKAYILLGGWQQAIRPLTRVIEADPENAEAYRLRGSGLAAIFKTTEAIADLQQATIQKTTRPISRSAWSTCATKITGKRSTSCARRFNTTNHLGARKMRRTCKDI